MGIELAVLLACGTGLMIILMRLFRGGLPGLRRWFEAVAMRGFGRGGRRRSRGADAGHAAKIKTCPLCGEMLARGELVKSVVFSGGTKNRSGGLTDTMSHLFGCPFCYPPNDRYRRICPYCKNEVPRDGHVIARYFDNRETGRKHIHVLGCTGCRRRSA